MKQSIYILVFAALLFGIHCATESATSTDEKTELIVVQAYLYAGEPVTDVRITSTLELGSEETHAPPINDANVALIKNSIRYELEPSPGDSGYYHYGGSDLSIETGDKFKIEVEYSGIVITGETEVPPAPRNISLSQTTITVPDFSNFTQGNRPDLSSSQFSIKWENEDHLLHFVVVDNIDENPVSIESPGMGFARRFNFISQPTNNDSIRINFMTLEQLGLHRVKVYRINQEYADLYETQSQDSRDLNEPLTNIVNGLGVFSAFNSDSTFFTVKN